jgi:hypothetical protein
MGQVLAQHMKERNLRDVFVDFENAKPEENDELGQSLQLLLNRIPSILTKIAE